MEGFFLIKTEMGLVLKPKLKFMLSQISPHISVDEGSRDNFLIHTVGLNSINWKSVTINYH